MALFDIEKRTAHFSKDRKYRFWLKIVWDEKLPLLVVIGLNPSTADEKKDDPTVFKCKKLAKSLGCGGLVMLNIFAFRATRPEDMFVAQDPVGCENNWFLHSLTKDAFIIIVAWGNGGLFKDRARYVLDRILLGRKLKCLKINKTGMPEHPLYCKIDCELQDYIWNGSN